MSAQRLDKVEYAKLSRMVCLLLNRSMMYSVDHPHIKDATDGLHQSLMEFSGRFSTLVLIMTRDQLFLDEEPVDPRINTSRIVSVFKKAGLQSISFSSGITPEALYAFIDVFTSTDQYPDSEKMTRELDSRGVKNLKLNHVFYKKITKDDDVVSRREKEQMLSQGAGAAGSGTSNQFMKMLADGFVAEGTGEALSMKKLLDDPAEFSKNMLDMENKTMQAVESGEVPEGSDEDGSRPTIPPGATLLYQVQALTDNVNQTLEAGGQVNMMEVSDAVFEMKRQLTAGIASQKAVNQAFTNEDLILGQMDELTDNVIIKLIRSEYKQGKITTVRLAQIIRRLVPEAAALKRLLPKIKAGLLAEGMPMAEYMQLVQHLGKELESDGLAQVLKEAAESVGMEGEDLIDEIRRKPEKAAELMAIAAELRKGTGDEKGFTEMLVNYVEQLGAKVQEEETGTTGGEGGTDARQVMTNVGSDLIAQLKKMNFSNDALLGMEERINARIQDVLGKLSADTAPIFPDSAELPEKQKTLLQLMEESAGENEELKHALQIIRTQANDKQIDENSFEQIYLNLIEHERALFEEEAKRQLPPGVLRYKDFKFYLKKELLKAQRYDIPLSALSFIILNVRLHDPELVDRKITKPDVIDAAYRKLLHITRGSDIVGELDHDTMVVILPMAGKDNADLALGRISKLLNDHIFEINGIRMNFNIAGSVASFLPNMKPSVDSFIRTISYELEHAASRMKKAPRLPTKPKG